MRIDSVGIEFLYCCSESPAVGLLAMYWIFWIILFSNACNDVSFFSLIYKEDWNQSFQYPKLKNSPMVANTGFDIGTIILEKDCKFGRSINFLADSTMESGIVDLKNVLDIMTKILSVYIHFLIRLPPIICNSVQSPINVPKTVTRAENQESAFPILYVHSKDRSHALNDNAFGKKEYPCAWNSLSFCIKIMKYQGLPE